MTGIFKIAVHDLSDICLDILGQICKKTWRSTSAKYCKNPSRGVHSGTTNCRLFFPPY